jgi:cytochrome c biogenesis protein CcmG/thiol:disulfide interchange protein DsbE
MTSSSRAAVLLCAVLLSCGAPARADTLDLDAYKGKVVYLDFWASWCNPCRESFPWLNELQQTYGPKGLVLIGVNVDHDRGLAEKFLQRYGAQFKIIYDTNGAIAEKYDFKDMPTSILIGRDGRVHYVHNGFYTNQEGTYTSHVSTLLDQKAP